MYVYSSRQAGNNNGLLEYGVVKCGEKQARGKMKISYGCISYN